MAPIFLIGAGFGVEARRTAGSIRGTTIYAGEYEIHCGYPLVRDLPRICFPDASPPVPPEAVEVRLAESIQENEWAPVDRLCKELAKADYYLAPRLFGPSEIPNPYLGLISDFTDSSYVSFNYDSFIEFGLFRAGRWSPHDGFGVDVAVEIGYSVDSFEVEPSRNLVLHLHGSLLVYTKEFSFDPPDESGVRWMRQDDPPRFMFDPLSVSTLFYPYGRVTPGLGYNPRLADRVIAPIPDKAEDDRDQFVRSVRARALELIRHSDTMVSIGYAYADLDGDSYTDLLEALATHQSPRLVIVSPNAEATAERLRAQVGGIEIRPQPMGFIDWAGGGYSGM